MLDSLDLFDRELFLSIHHFRNVVLDFIMPWITNRWVWIPLYALLLLLVYKSYGKKLVWIVPAIVVLIIISDQGANLMKNGFKRPRPCHQVAISEQVVTPLGCGGPYGFVSGHASNSMALATFLFLLTFTHGGLRAQRKWWILLFLWAAIVAWSRIYVGVHYPFDVLLGATFGALCGLLMYLLIRKKITHE
jgi:undecaprenyl-diphosphatase